MPMRGNTCPDRSVMTGRGRCVLRMVERAAAGLPQLSAVARASDAGNLKVQGVAALDDDELVFLVRQGNAFAFRIILKRNNQRLYRLARSLLKDEFEAEDAMQETYLRAFANLSDFRGDSGIWTWLTRIMLNETLGRLRRRRTMIDLARSIRRETTCVEC